MLDLLIFYIQIPAECKITLLVAVSVLPAAIRAFPGNSVAGHPPLVFIHTSLADGESAPAIPAEHEGLSAAMALF
jgi:hypothetical protein